MKKSAVAEAEKGRPVAPDGADLYECEECVGSKLFREEDLKPMHHAWSNHADGDTFHPYVCPDCGATVNIAAGPAFRFPPTVENLKKHAYHSGIDILFGKGMKAPELTCKQCSDAQTRKVEESAISKPGESSDEESEES